MGGSHDFFGEGLRVDLGGRVKTNSGSGAAAGAGVDWGAAGASRG